MHRCSPPSAARAPSMGWLALGVAALAGVLGLAGCSVLPESMGGTPPPPKPANLAPNPNLLGVRQAWTGKIGAVGFPLDVRVVGQRVMVAASDGTVTTIDTTTGAILWRASAGAALAAGVGGDGDTAAVVTRDGDLIVLNRERTLWRQRLAGQVHTAPLMAGGRVFVLAADRTVSAFDASNGARLWTQQRPGEALVLRQAGVILPVGNTLVVGQGGRMAGFNPDNGTIRWEAALASSRGTNDVERLVDLVGRVSRVGDSVCARAFQASVGCVDAQRGAVVWARPAAGAEGLHGDERQIFGTESDGRVVAWRRSDGERLWSVDALRFRGLTTPVLLGRSLAVGDAQGLVHLLSREDGSLLNRLTTDGTGIAAAPVLAGNTLVVVTRSGGIFGFVPI
jgi:outer membrane protein assembly factor BamB